MSEGQYVYEYPRPMVVVDAVVFVLVDRLRVLVIERGHEPFKGMWALPGGFVDMEEGLAEASARELAEETGLTGVRLTQIGAFGDVGRDPRGRVIGVAYVGLIDSCQCKVQAGDDAADVAWLPALELPPMASDHNLIVNAALDYLRVLIKAGAIGPLLPEKLTAAELGDALNP